MDQGALGSHLVFFLMLYLPLRTQLHGHVHVLRMGTLLRTCLSSLSMIAVFLVTSSLLAAGEREREREVSLYPSLRLSAPTQRNTDSGVQLRRKRARYIPTYLECLETQVPSLRQSVHTTCLQHYTYLGASNSPHKYSLLVSLPNLCPSTHHLCLSLYCTARYISNVEKCAV